jgi:hypothetical protein
MLGGVEAVGEPTGQFDLILVQVLLLIFALDVVLACGLVVR